MGWRSHLNRVSRWGILRGDMLSRFGRAFWGYNESFPTDKWVLLPHPIKKVNVGHVGFTYIYISIIPWIFHEIPLWMGDCWFISLFLLIPKALFVIPLADRSSFFFTPQVIGAVIGAAWHMAREKVSTNWAANSGRVAVPPRTRERRDVQRESGPPKKNAQWVADRPLLPVHLPTFKSTDLSKKRHFFFMWFKVGDTCFPSWKPVAFCSCRCFAKRPPWYQR